MPVWKENHNCQLQRELRDDARQSCILAVLQSTSPERPSRRTLQAQKWLAQPCALLSAWSRAQAMLAAAWGSHIRSCLPFVPVRATCAWHTGRCLSHCPGCCIPGHLTPGWAGSPSLGLTDSTPTVLAQAEAIPIFHEPLRSTAWQPLAKELVKTHFQTAMITPSG